jgi:hypothetical protein
MPIEAKSKVSKDYEPHFAKDRPFPDTVVTIPGAGRVLMHQGEGCQTAYIPRPDSNMQIAISVVTLTPGEEYDGVGFIHLMSPVEARMIAKSLLDMADNGQPEEGEVPRAN